MVNPSLHIQRNLLIAVFSSIVVTLIWFGLTWRYGFDLADEGYYWYGSQRVLRGEVPFRDFLSYDIGRYLWAAAVMFLLGDDGLFAAHVAALLYQIITICVGIFLLLQMVERASSSTKKIVYAVLAATIFDLWVVPYYKVFDYGTSILIVAILSLMMQRRDTIHWLYAGLILGFAAVMGRNHGLYGVACALLALVFLVLKGHNPRALLFPGIAFIIGTTIGFSPTFIMGAIKPGFLDAFIASVIEHVHSTTTATNIPLPIPWPWTIVHDKYGWVRWASGVAKGIGFMLLPLVPIGIIFRLSRRRLDQLTQLEYTLLASAFAGLVYSHYAYSRADLIHLALSIFPLMLVALGLGVLAQRMFRVELILIVISTLTVASDVLLLNSKLLGQKTKTVMIDGIEMQTFPFTEKNIREANAVIATVPEAKDNFLAVPAFPGLYAMNRSRIGIWEIYALSYRAASFEHEEMLRLEKSPPKVILLSTQGVDNNPELRYSRIHPMIYNWIKRKYRYLDMVPDSELQAYVPK